MNAGRYPNHYRGETLEQNIERRLAQSIADEEKFVEEAMKRWYAAEHRRDVRRTRMKEAAICMLAGALLVLTIYLILAN